MLMRAPRILRIWSSCRASRSSPAKVTLPVTRACGGSSRRMASDVADFPDPDSPTSPSVPDSAMEKLTSCTAATSPVCVAKVTFRCSTWRREGTASGADLVGRDSRLDALVHGCDKRRLLMKQGAGGGGELAFQV